MPNKHSSLVAWVDYIQTLHAREIDLSLDRVNIVFKTLFPAGDPFKSVIIAGTNGKGSTAELLSSVMREAGYRIGKFTSPHLINFNERFNIDGESVGDEALLAAFHLVEEARDDVTLTFFEFGTLLAIVLFAQANVDLAVMEVGLGGRLDAVNILSPEVSVITSIAKDHTAWLGDSIEQIATEKFGVARPQKPCVLAMLEPPEKILALALERDVRLLRAGQDFNSLYLQESPTHWQYQGAARTFSNLPLPFGQAGHQLQNAAAVIAVVEALGSSFIVSEKQLQRGLAESTIYGRCQILTGQPKVIVDVAHNEASVLALAEFLSQQHVRGRTLAVCGMLKDKEVSAALGGIANQIDAWYLASIDGERGSTAQDIAGHLQTADRNLAVKDVKLFAGAQLAFDKARDDLREDDCLVVFGSFFIVGDILAHQVNT